MNRNKTSLASEINDMLGEVRETLKICDYDPDRFAIVEKARFSKPELLELLHYLNNIYLKALEVNDIYSQLPPDVWKRYELFGIKDLTECVALRYAKKDFKGLIRPNLMPKFYKKYSKEVRDEK